MEFWSCPSWEGLANTTSSRQPVHQSQENEHVQPEVNPSDIGAAAPSVSSQNQTSRVELNTGGTNYESNVTEADSSDSDQNTVLHVSTLGGEDTSIA